MNNIPFLLAVLLLSSFTSRKSEYEPGPTIQSEVQILCNGDLRYLELSGTPYERGHTHGRLMKEDIHKLLQLWKEDIRRSTRMDADEFISIFLAGTDYRSAIETYVPELLEELRGIAEGSGAGFTYHTNHPLANSDYSQRFLGWLKNNERSPSEVWDNCRRLPAMRARFNEATADITIDDIKEALSSRDDDRDPVSNPSTYASVIYELGDNPRLHIAAGKPHEKSFFIIEF